ncbi:MAG: 5'/3'-nucleotidase SurE [candidate division Zixibacteria bacterium HGW-Zixibacteria-1]|nr:MAG: 5'/3'-nucleotidase SurE [candidate division Zixibacteria bacterium HGW-Zixibacteria-1]
MLILLTNDDGIYAEGLNALEMEIKHFAEVLVVAPDREQSASSHSFTLNRPLRLHQRGPYCYSCDGTPTDCVMLATHGILKDRLPDLLISGINHGANMGEDVTYSGTVAAAIEGSILGIKSLAVSNTDDENIGSYKPAAEFIAKFIQQMHKFNLPIDTFLNINFPKLSGTKFAEYRYTRLGKRVYNDIVIEKTDPRGRNYYWIAGDSVWKDVAGSDFEAVSHGAVSISPLKVNFSDFDSLDAMKNVNLRL